MAISRSLADLLTDGPPVSTGSGTVPASSGVGVASTKNSGVAVVLINAMRQAIVELDEQVAGLKKDLHIAAFNARHNDHHLFYQGLGILGPTELEPTTETQITADTNDWALTEPATWHRISSDAARVVTGIAAPTADGTVKILTNVGAFNMTFNNQDALSAAGNRIITGTGAAIVLAADQSICLIYDLTTTRWRVW